MLPSLLNPFPPTPPACGSGELDLDKGGAASDLRQALLEAPSIASRLRYVLAVLQTHSKVLAALVAVKDVQQQE